MSRKRAIADNDKSNYPAAMEIEGEEKVLMRITITSGKRLRHGARNQRHICI